MANTVFQFKRSIVPGKSPDSANLQIGEIALNLTDKRIYSKHSGGYIVTLSDYELANSAYLNSISAYIQANAAFSAANNANTWLQANDATTLASAKSYTDAANTWLRANDATTLASAKSYTDAANTWLRANDATTLASAKSYTDAANTWLQANDATTLASAKTYANANDATTLASAYANDATTLLLSRSFSANAANISLGTISGDRGVTAGSTLSSFIEYNGTTKTAGQFDGGSTDPTNTARLNYDGNFYATTFYGSGAGLTSIPNSSLSNTFLTLGTTPLYLGGTNTSVAGLTLTNSAFNGTVGATTPSTGAFTSISATGQITSTDTWDAATGGGNIYLNSTTGNRIDWNINGVAAPAVTTRSVGTKLVLYPNITASTTDFALGIEMSTLWNSVPASNYQFKWYANTTEIMTLSGTGFLTLSGGGVNTAAATPLTIDSGTTGALSIGNSASAKTITLGNATGATAIIANSGTGGITFNQVAAGTFAVKAVAAQTSDMTLISNFGYPTSTAGVNNLQIDYFGGNVNIEGGAQRITIWPGNTAGGIWNGLRIIPGYGANTGTTLNGIKFDNVSSAPGTENMIFAGTGWSNIINYNGISVIDGNGNVNASMILTGSVPSAALTNAYANDGVTLASAYANDGITLASARANDYNTIIAAYANDGITLASARANDYNTIIAAYANDGVTLASARANDGVTLASAYANDGITLAAARGFSSNAANISLGVLAISRGGTGNTTAPTANGIIFAGSTTSYSSTPAGTIGQILTANTGLSPSWQTFDFALHAPDSSFKKICRLATTTDLGASTFGSNILKGYDPGALIPCTTSNNSQVVTTTSTAFLKSGATVNVATIQIAAGTTVAEIITPTTFTLNKRANLTTTSATANGDTAFLTYAAQTYAPYAVGALIAVSGITPTEFNGNNIVTSCNTTTVTYNLASSNTATVQGLITFDVATGSSISTSFIQTIAALSVDGLAVAVNDRILVKDQSTVGGVLNAGSASNNGIYAVTATGSASVPWTLQRAGDADASGDIDSAVVNVSVGTTNGGKTFQTYFKSTDTLNTTGMYWNRVVDVSSSRLLSVPTTGSGIDIATETKSIIVGTGGLQDLSINSFGQVNVSAIATSTYNRVSTLYIPGPPISGNNAIFANNYSIYVAGTALSRIPSINFDREINANAGIVWYSSRSTSNAWVQYMSAQGQTGVGPKGNLTTPTGSIVTSWALRSFVDSAPNYGWTFESANATSNTPSIVAEISSTNGSSRFAGTMYLGSSITTGLALTNTSITSAAAAPLTIDSGTTGSLNIGTTASAKTITLGNATGATTLIANSGTGGITFNQVASGPFTVKATAARTADMAVITNVGQPTVTAGVNNLQLDFFGGAAAVEAGAQRISIWPGNTASGTWNALRIVPGYGANTGTTLNAIKVDAVVSGAGTENALYVGTGWNNIINYNGISVIEGNGNVNASMILTGTIPGERGVSAGSTTPSFIKYNGTTATDGQFYGGTTNPSNNNVRLNYEGIFYANTFYGLGTGLTGQANNFSANISYYNVISNANSGKYYPQLVSTTTGTLAGYSNNSFSFDVANSRMGIGTSSPFSQLDVYESIASPTTGEATGVGSIRITNGSSALSSRGGLEFKNAGDTNGYGAKIQSLNSGGPQLVFANRSGTATWTERMRIDSSGNVGIGIDSPGARFAVREGLGQISFQVFGDTTSKLSNVANAAQVRIKDPIYSESASGATYITHETNGTTCFGNSRTDTLSKLRFFTTGSGGTPTERVTIDDSGGVTFSGSIGVGTSPSGTVGEIRAINNITAYYSDERLKNVEGEILNALEKIKKMSGVYYTSNELAAKYGYQDKSRQVGVIAQEVQKELPEIVKLAPFDSAFTKEKEEYSISGEKYLTVQYEKLIPVLIQAIKELNKKVENLEEKLNAKI